MPLPDRHDAGRQARRRRHAFRRHARGVGDGPNAGGTAAPGVLTTLLCERCGNENLIRVKGCWYCEKCHYKFDCYGF